MANNVTDLGKVGITLKGEWSSATNYERLDAVTYEGSLYIAIKDNANVNPGANPTYWLLSAKHGEFTDEQLEDFKAEVVAESKEEMDDYTADKKAELDTYEGTKETELNTYTGTKKTELDTYAGGLKDDFDDNASTKTTAFNDNATSKTNAFNTNATNKTTDFNDNATAKTTEFNTNASDKTDDFNDNVTAKTTAFDEHVEEKTEEFDENAESLQQEIDELSENMPWETTEQATEIQVTDAAKYSRNRLELFGNTEQASYVGKNLFNVGSETINSRGIDWIPQNDGSVKIQGTATGASTYGISSEKIIPAGQYIFSIKNPMGQKLKLRSKKVSDGTFSYASIAIGQTSTIINIPEDVNLTQIYIDSELTAGDELNYTIYPQLEQGSTATDYEQYVGGVPSPNPDYPQPIHVVTRNNVIKRTGKNLLDLTNAREEGTNGGITCTKQDDGTYTFVGTSTTSTINFYPLGSFANYSTFTDYESFDKSKISFDLAPGTYTVKDMVLFMVFEDNTKTATTLNIETGGVNTFTLTQTGHVVALRAPQCESGKTYNIVLYPQLEQGSTATSYEPYELEEYPVNLGDIELCGNENHKDEMFKNEPNNPYYDNTLVENGWYKKKRIGKYYFSMSRLFQVSGNNFYLNITGGAIHSKGYMPSYKYDSRTSGFNNMGNYYFGFEAGGALHVKNSNYTDRGLFTQSLVNANEYIYYVLKTPENTQITDTTLISQLDEIYEHLKLIKGINNITVTAEDLAPYMKLSYMQDLKSKLDNIDSRLSLLE